MFNFVVGVHDNNLRIQMANLLIHCKLAIVSRESLIKVTKILITSIWIQEFGNIIAKLPFVALNLLLQQFICTVHLHCKMSCNVRNGGIGNPGNFASLKKITDFSNNLNKISNFFLKKKQRFSKEASKNFKGSFKVFPRKLRRTLKEASKKTWRKLQSF
jgi:hypothetical protein